MCQWPFLSRSWQHEIVSDEDGGTVAAQHNYLFSAHWYGIDKAPTDEGPHASRNNGRCEVHL
jgi:hypothetical protein